MAYGVVHQFPGGTKEQYEASIAAVHPSDGGLPEGQIFHAAGRRPAAGRSSRSTSPGELGAVPRRDAHAGHGRGYRGRLRNAAAGDRLRDPQPAEAAASVAELGEQRAGLGLDVRDLLRRQVLAPAADRGVAEAVHRPMRRGRVRRRGTPASSSAPRLGESVSYRISSRRSPAPPRARPRRSAARPTRSAARRSACSNSSRRSGSTQKRGVRAVRAAARRRAPLRPALSQPRSSSEQTTSRPSRTTWTRERLRIRLERRAEDVRGLGRLLDAAQPPREPDAPDRSRIVRSSAADGRVRQRRLPRRHLAEVDEAGQRRRSRGRRTSSPSAGSRRRRRAAPRARASAAARARARRRATPAVRSRTARSQRLGKRVRHHARAPAGASRSAAAPRRAATRARRPRRAAPRSSRAPASGPWRRARASRRRPSRAPSRRDTRRARAARPGANRSAAAPSRSARTPA